MPRANALSAGMKEARHKMGEALRRRKHTNRMRVLAFGRSSRGKRVQPNSTGLCPPRKRSYKLPVNSSTHYCKPESCDIAGSKHGGR